MTIIILASGRTPGNTSRAVSQVMQAADEDIALLDLRDYNIGYYDYEHSNADDDFMQVIRIMMQHDSIIFATPVYWYSMSAQLKTFFDRFTDLITLHKDVGRGLRGKRASVIACGAAEEMPPSFTDPFTATFSYLGMEYVGHCYFRAGDESVTCDGDPGDFTQLA